MNDIIVDTEHLQSNILVLKIPDRPGPGVEMQLQGK